jgi:hypothetical protein
LGCRLAVAVEDEVKTTHLTDGSFAAAMKACKRSTDDHGDGIIRIERLHDWRCHMCNPRSTFDGIIEGTWSLHLLYFNQLELVGTMPSIEEFLQPTRPVDITNSNPDPVSGF